jgi:UDP-N-acetylglucosamine 2-epimerase (non-hydrolysing)
VVQGDTTTAFVAALAAFYDKVPVAHVEAGLRTADFYSPFPEEINRRLTGQLASLHLAPTPVSKANLLKENISPDRIVVTGNTVIDALFDVVARRLPYTDPVLEQLSGRTMVLITAHRRESWGEPMARAAGAIGRLAREFPEVAFVLPAHLNPVVREVLLPPLAGLPNVTITEPLPYGQFSRLMQDSHVILTDSGGVQEEGPSLGKPVLVMRESTERPEAVDAGTVSLVGTDAELIVSEVRALLTDQARYSAMANAVNPYGDGRAAARSVQAMGHYFGLNDSPAEFDPDAVSVPV